MGSTATGAAEGLVDYLNASWTAFHAVEESKKMLLQNGYVEISELESWCVLRVACASAIEIVQPIQMD